jgi:outer membrane receptor for ferrienterochelin and colicins
MKNRFTVFLPLMLAASNIVAAEEPVIVVSGAKVDQNIADTVEAVEVISREEINAMGAKTVAEVMENIPGVVIFDHPQATVMMQGFEGAYVKILIDGIEISGDVAGATPVSMLPVADIERIEIVRGASSVLYGSDAMGGVINIITKKPAKDRFSFQTKQEFASNLRYYGDAYVGYANKLFALSLGGSFDWDKGKVVAKENTLGRQIDIYDVAAVRMGAARANAIWYHPGGELELYGSWSNSLMQFSADMDNGYDFTNTKFEGGIKESYRFSDFALINGFFSYRQLDYDADRHNYAFSTTAPYADSLFRDIEGELRFSWDPAISHSLLFGVNAKREALDSDSFDAEKSMVLIGVFAQDTWNIKGADTVRVVPGIRFDYRPPNSSEEDHIFKFTPKLSLRYDPVKELVLRLSYGMGFKTPSLKQNYWVFFHPAPYNFLLTGNPSLKPETSHGINTSADYSITKEITLSVAGYFNYIFDLIDDYISDEAAGSALNSSGQTQPFIYTRGYRNVGKAITAGGDVSFRFNGKRLKAMAAYDLTIARGYDEETDTYKDLTSRVPHQVSASVAYTIPVIETTALVRLNWNAPQRISDTEHDVTPDYLMASIRVSKYFFKEKLEVYAGVQNALNNIHFIKGTGGLTQKDYYGLRDGIIFSLGANFKW